MNYWEDTVLSESRWTRFAFSFDLNGDLDFEMEDYDDTRYATVRADQLDVLERAVRFGRALQELDDRREGL
jgi:hypothetical protein